jgi:RcsF protein
MKKITINISIKAQRPLLSVLTLLLCSCNSNFTVSTNVDSNNFKDYFSASKVAIYQSENEMLKRYKFIGLVEGQDCQLKAHHGPPDKINARTDARKQAFEQQANAVVFTGCVIIDSAVTHQQPQKQQCLSTLVCYAKAYQVDTNAQSTHSDNKQ